MSEKMPCEERIAELEAALREPLEEFAYMVVVHEAWCHKPLLGGCTCTLSKWHDWRNRARLLFPRSSDARSGDRPS